MPAATNEPKVRTRTSSAMPMPMSSEVAPGCIISCMPWPPAAMVSPFFSAALAASRMLCCVSGLMSMMLSTAKFHDTVPMRPSLLSGESASAFFSATALGVPCFVACATICCFIAGPASAGLASFVFGICWTPLTFLISSSTWPL